MKSKIWLVFFDLENIENMQQVLKQDKKMIDKFKLIA
jgi:hypothetical protein